MSESRAASGWIVSPRYDLPWFFGGALASVAAIGLVFAARVPIVVLYWIWLLAFDGPHIGAAFTRTYLDRDEWRTRRRVLLVSLLAFAVGPVFLTANLATGTTEPFQLYLGLATLYGYYHVVRQHYGFLALYKARTKDADRIDFHVDRAFLYASCWAPYAYFILTHPRARVLLRLAPDGPNGGLEKAAVAATLVVWGAATLAFLVRLLPRLGERLRRPHVPYLIVTAALYAVTYLVVGRYEPVYAASRGPDQDFLLIQILVTLPHNVQYLGLVWFHNRNRYGSAEGDPGPARAVNRTPARYLAACLAFSGVVYFLSAASTGVFPGIQFFLEAKVGPFTANQLALCAWWGLAFNHYYLDQKIWRIRGDDRLKRALGFPSTATSSSPP